VFKTVRHDSPHTLNPSADGGAAGVSLPFLVGQQRDRNAERIAGTVQRGTNFIAISGARPTSTMRQPIDRRPLSFRNHWSRAVA